MPGVADDDEVTCLCAPSVDSARELFDCGQVLGEQTGRIGGGNARLTFQVQHVGDQLLGYAHGTCARTGDLASVTDTDAVQAGNVPQQLRECRSGCRDELGDVGRPASGLDERLPQVHEVAFRLQLACPPQVLLGDCCRAERVVSVDELVRSNDLSVFQREDVERS